MATVTRDNAARIFALNIGTARGDLREAPNPLAVSNRLALCRKLRQATGRSVLAAAHAILEQNRCAGPVPLPDAGRPYALAASRVGEPRVVEAEADTPRFRAQINPGGRDLRLHIRDSLQPGWRDRGPSGRERTYAYALAGKPRSAALLRRLAELNGDARKPRVAMPRAKSPAAAQDGVSTVPATPTPPKPRPPATRDRDTVPAHVWARMYPGIATLHAPA